MVRYVNMQPGPLLLLETNDSFGGKHVPQLLRNNFFLTFSWRFDKDFLFTCAREEYPLKTSQPFVSLYNFVWLLSSYYFKM